MEHKAICCIIGAVLINLTLGTFYSIGNITPYVASYMRNNGNPDVTTEHGTWLTASFLLGQGAFLIVGAYIERIFDSRISCIIGCVIHCVSTYLTIWALRTNFMMVILIYGLGSGMGAGASYMASIIAAQKWFPQSKGFFTGIIVGGFGFGGLIFTSLQTLYMNPENLNPDSSGYFPKSVYARVPNLFLYMGIIFTIAQTVGCLLAFPPPTSNQPKSVQPETKGVNVEQDDGLPNLKTISATFSHRIFYVIGAMMMLVAPGVTFVNSLGKRYGQSYINDDRYLATVVAVAAVANALGRLTWGFFMDKFPFVYCFSAKVLIFSILIVLFPFEMILGSKLLYLIWMLGLFFSFSGTFVLFPVFIEQVFGVKYQGIIYGILYIFLALASIMTSLLIQVTISPALAKATNPGMSIFIRAAPCMVIAVLYIIALVIYITLVPVRRLENAIRRKLEMDVAKNRNTLFQRQDLYPLERGTLAEKTSKTNSTLDKEQSLGSIVRYRSASPPNVNGGERIKRLGKA